MNTKKILLLCTLLNSTFLSYASDGKQPVGLDNFGATCYVNATIQSLYNCATLTEYLLTHSIQFPHNSLADTYVQLIKAIRSVSTQGPTTQSLDQLWRMELWNFVQRAYEVMGGCGHMDANEFISNLLENLGNGSPELKKLFSIGQASIVECTIENIQYERKKVEVENLMNFQIAGFTTLLECLSSYFDTEQLTDPYALDLTHAELQKQPGLRPYNKTYIPGCSRRIGIEHLSDIVIITLKRFAQDLETNAPYKLSHDITVEQTLNFGAFMTRQPAPDYELTGAVVHSGTLRFGHYIAYVKVDDQWYKCNDTVVEPVSWAQMVYPPEQWKEYGVNKSYALFYKRGVTGSIQPTPPKPKILNLTEALKNLQVALDGLQVALRN